MRYSIVNVYRRHGGRVDGAWLQDSVGSLDKARAIARRTSQANSGADIAVTEPVCSVTPLLSNPHHGLREVACTT